MSLRVALTSACAGAIAAGIFFTPGCSGDDSANASDSGSDVVLIFPDAGDAASDSGDAGEAPSIGGRNFVAHELYLGDIERDGGLSATAWQDFGANVDGKTTASDSTDVCTLTAGAPSSVQIDGPGGLDNSFGANVLPIFLNIIGSNLDNQVNMSIDQGGPTFMIDLNGLTDDTSQSLDPMPGHLFGGVHFGAPSWDTGTRWSVYKNTTVSGTLASGAKADFPEGKMATGTWSSNGAGDIQLALFGLSITVHHATISFSHVSANHISGMVSGVIDTEEFVEAVRVAFATLEGTSFCSGGSIDAIAAQIRQASDILKDGTNSAGPACNGISIGLGFEADETAPPNAVADAPAPTNPCGD